MRSLFCTAFLLFAALSVLQTTPALDIAGSWSGFYENLESEQQHVLKVEIRRSGDKYSGTASLVEEKAKVVIKNVEQDDDSLLVGGTMSVPDDAGKMIRAEFTLDGTLDDDETWNGMMSIAAANGGFVTTPFELKKDAAAGKPVSGGNAGKIVSPGGGGNTSGSGGNTGKITPPNQGGGNAGGSGETSGLIQTPPAKGSGKQTSTPPAKTPSTPPTKTAENAPDMAGQWGGAYAHASGNKGSIFFSLNKSDGDYAGMVKVVFSDGQALRMDVVGSRFENGRFILVSTGRVVADDGAADLTVEYSGKIAGDQWSGRYSGKDETGKSVLSGRFSVSRANESDEDWEDWE